MFVCTECGMVFEEPIKIEEDRGEYFGFPAYEEFYVCPKCKGVYVEAHRCDSCDEWIDGTYIKTDDDKRYCLNCYRVAELGDED